MKIFKLLEGLYQELKIFNEKCPDYLSDIMHEKKIYRLNSKADIESLKIWLDGKFDNLRWEEIHKAKGGAA